MPQLSPATALELTLLPFMDAVAKACKLNWSRFAIIVVSEVHQVAILGHRENQTDHA